MGTFNSNCCQILFLNALVLLRVYSIACRHGVPRTLVQNDGSSTLVGAHPVGEKFNTNIIAHRVSSYRFNFKSRASTLVQKRGIGSRASTGCPAPSHRFNPYAGCFTTSKLTFSTARGTRALPDIPVITRAHSHIYLCRLGFFTFFVADFYQ